MSALFRSDRRSLLIGAASATLLALPRAHAAERKKNPSGLSFRPPRPFNFNALKKRAQTLATQPYNAPAPPVPELVNAIDFDLNGKIKFRPEFELWPHGPGPYPVRFFHLSRFVGLPVKIFAVQGPTAREVIYASRYFDYGNTGLDKKLPPNLGFSGFRVMNGANADVDWLAFQGASYFRSSGAENQYGQSARGIAVDTALATQEEFPRFTEFYLGEDPRGSGITIYALLEGQSLTGAYKIDASRGDGVVTTVHADLFVRADIERLGIAPLTSMYWSSESNARRRADWRPQIHDSDGLSLWTGKGEHIWRPLNDPPSLQTNAFMDTNPKGFGLLQRDRDFNDYQDDGAFYNKRPNVWVEPIGDWGDGAVELVEIPTDDEIHDNIVAYWQPRAPVKAGANMSVTYRLFWSSAEPQFPATLARVVATRIGRGGVPGQAVPKNEHKFVIDFEGGPLSDMAPRFDVTPVVSLSHGRVARPYVIKVVGTNRWRAFFDVALDDSRQLDLRCFLKLGDKTLSETWLYQYFPPVA